MTSSRWKIIAGVCFSAVPIVMMAFSAFLKFAHSPQVVAGMQKFGYSESAIVPIGIMEIACVVLYAIPRMSVFGAILMTGYLGGAVATHVRVGDPAFVGPAICGITAWVGLWLREERLHALIPLRKRVP